MNLNLMTLLYNRLIASAGLDIFSDGPFYDLTHDASGNIVSVVWIHGTMIEPTQADLDAEDLIYQDEQLEKDVRLVINEVLRMYDPAWDIEAHWISGDYLSINWQDDLTNTSNDSQRLSIQSQIDDLVIKENEAIKRSDEINLIASPTKEELIELSNIDIYILDLAQQIADFKVILNGIKDLTIVVKPSWDIIKLKYAEYKKIKDDEKIKLDSEKKDYKLIDVDLILSDMLGSDVSYTKGHNTHWDDIKIFSSHEKPLFSQVKLRWANIKKDLDFNVQLDQLNNQMDTKIFTKASQLLGTTKFESMMFFSQSWHLKRDYAKMYVSDGLTVFKLTTSFQTLSEPLDTELKISSYYDELCKEVLVIIDKYRDNEIQSFLTAKSVL